MHVALPARAHDAFGDVIELLAGTSETSVYACMPFRPETYAFGRIGPAVMGGRT